MNSMSAAAYITVLLKAAAKVFQVLLRFVGSVEGAPRFPQRVLMEVSDVNACLIQLQRCLHRTSLISSSQEQLLVVDDFITTMSNCVLIFSELEHTVDSLKPAEPMQP